MRYFFRYTMVSVKHQILENHLRMRRRWLLVRISIYLATATLVATLNIAYAGLVAPWSYPERQARRYADTGLFHPDSQHISNRLYRHIHVRTASDGNEYGFQNLDPLLWRETKYLLTGASAAEALQLLDQFLEAHAEQQIWDPARRAILQRALWAVFDWAAPQPAYNYKAERLELMTRLAQVIRRLALNPGEIDALPDTYERAIRAEEFPSEYEPAQPNRPFLPPDFLDSNGSWVCIGASDGELAAPAHNREFSGRSAFLIFMRLPEGRQATLDYLKRLADLRIPLMIVAQVDGQAFFDWNPEVPHFPVGTELALVRKMVLPDHQGNLVLTPITESIQIRHYREIPPGVSRDHAESRRSQGVTEIRLDRARLFEGRGSGLRGVAAQDKEFTVFMSHGIDPFERGRIMFQPWPTFETCTGCHIGPGVQSMMSFSFRNVPARNPRLAETTPAREAEKVIAWKLMQDNWTELMRLWNVNSARAIR